VTTVVNFGEIMLRLSPPRQERFFQSPELRTFFGGSEANVAVGLAHLGVASTYVTRLPSNPVGDAALAALRAEGLDLADPEIIARTGWRTDDLDAAITAAAPKGPYALVSLLIGVNNQYRGRPLDEFRAQFGALLERAIALAHGRADRVLVLSIPDWGVTRFGAASGRDATTIARELDAFNAAARDVCEARGVAFVDITGVSRAHGAEDAMLVDDGLHPSAAMYALWTDAAFPAARRLLAR
jgi:lysophospholipase L1-like esterase